MANFSILHEDAIVALRSLPNKSIDLIVTDPAYESLEKHRRKGTTTRLKDSKSSSNEWFQIFPNHLFMSLFAEMYRVMKPDSHMYMMCDQETMFFAKPIAERVGFKFWKPIIWDKMTIGMGYHYRSQYEMILFFEKGKRPLNDKSIPDVIRCKRVRKGYPTEKPVSLLETLISQSSVKGDVILDPFVGSGAVGVAAMNLSRGFIGSDISESAIELATDRISGAGGILIDPVNRGPCQIDTANRGQMSLFTERQAVPITPPGA